MESKVNPLWTEWITETDLIEERLNRCTIGSKSLYGRSFGGRPLYKITYGDLKILPHQANYSSATGAHDITAYKKPGMRKPHILIFAAIHGMEIEGTAAVMGLIELLEGNTNWPGFDTVDRDALLKLSEQVTITLIPMANPDGRDRHQDNHWCIGMTFDELRYVMQGTWSNNELCGWPDCKKVHPMRPEVVGHLGAYFNDQGVNPMHDSFPLMQAPENLTLFELVDLERPDYILSLHGGTNTTNCFTWPEFVTADCTAFNASCSAAMTKRGQERGLPFADIFANKPLYEIDTDALPSFNLISALHNFSGSKVILYESNQGLDIPDSISLEPDEILQSHGVLFHTLLEQVLENNN